jgi:hypothetical protein
MTKEGWIFMLSSVGFVLCLLGFCFYRVLTAPNAKNNNQNARQTKPQYHSEPQP